MFAPRSPERRFFITSRINIIDIRNKGDKMKMRKVLILTSLTAMVLVAGNTDGREMKMNAKNDLHEKLMVGENVAPWDRLGVSQEAYQDFEYVWRQIEGDVASGQLAIPATIVWLNGAPGAGKGTNVSYIQSIFSIACPPIVTSDLLLSEEFQKIKDSGYLVGNRDVTALLFRKLLSKEFSQGVVVDGYPRTKAQAECVKLLHQKIRELKKRSDFRAVILTVPEAVSVERQLGRGRRAQKNNERVAQTGQGTLIDIRKTDSDPEAARTRYQVFLKETQEALDVLDAVFPCHSISAEGSFEDVRSRIYETIHR